MSRYNQHSDPYAHSEQAYPDPAYHYDPRQYDQPSHAHPQQQPYSNQPPAEQYYSEYPDQPAGYYPDPAPHPDQYPPPTDAYDPHYNQTYPPDQYYPDGAQQPAHDGYYAEFDPAAGYPPDEKHPAELYPPSMASGSGRLAPHEIQSPGLHSATAFAAPTRGSIAAQMAAEGAIPEKAGLRMWRSDEHSGAFMRGGKGKSCGRCCCCTMIVVALLVVGIIAGFLLWVRPPNATFNGIAPPTAGNQVDLQPNGFLLNFDLNIGVTNPNFFGASFPKISAKAYYPLNKTTPLGGGVLENVEIKPHSNTTIDFPFQINYTTSMDPNKAILADIASKCGFLGATKTPIKISFDVTLKLKVLAVTISPTFSSSNQFTCPLKQSDFTSVLGPTQSLDALASVLTGSGQGGQTAAAGAAAAPAAKPKRLSKRMIDEADAQQVQAILGRTLQAALEGNLRLRLSAVELGMPGLSQGQLVLNRVVGWGNKVRRTGIESGSKSYKVVERLWRTGLRR